MAGYYNNDDVFNIEGISVIEQCPHCKRSIAPQIRYTHYLWDKEFNDPSLQIALECPRELCGKLYLADIVYQRFEENGVEKYFMVDYVMYPTKHESYEDEEIASISPAFIKIYNQTLKADEMNLSEIVGVGYRRSVEFLMKDYIKKLIKDGEVDGVTEEDVEKSYRTSKLINNYIRDIRVKEVGKKFFDLSNDYAHYERIYTNRDINDLKVLIQLLIYEIKMNIVYREYENL